MGNTRINPESETVEVVISFIDESGPVTLEEGHRIVDVAKDGRVVGQICHTCSRFLNRAGEYVYHGDGGYLAANELQEVVEHMKMLQELHP